MSSPADREGTADRGRPFADLSAEGLLWLINSMVFHPRGFALALHIDRETGEVTGWSMLGDGSEPWYFRDDTADEHFARAEAFLNSLRAPTPDTAMPVTSETP